MYLIARNCELFNQAQTVSLVYVKLMGREIPHQDTNILFLFQAYPEYLICYQILKPDSNSDDGGSVDGITP